MELVLNHNTAKRYLNFSSGYTANLNTLVPV
jgi:hypothetical protein